MNWDVHIGNMVTKGWKAIHLCLRTFKNRHAPPMLVLWQTIIRPVIMYNTSVMGNLNNSQYQQLERLQKYFLRKIIWAKDGSLMPKDLQYHKLLEALDIMSIQRYREWTMLKVICNQIKRGKLQEICLQIISENPRVVLWCIVLYC